MRTIRRRIIGGFPAPAIDKDANAFMQILREKVSKAPRDPGIYKWLDEDGRIIYVGKAKNLRNRLKSYVTGAHRDIGFMKRGLWEKMADLEYTITRSEIEALILEMHLIRRHKPQYNVLLKRDKHYAFVRIGMMEPYPSVLLVHKKEADGALYFGPFTNVWSQRQMLAVLQSLYQFRTCRMQIEPVKQTRMEWRLENEKYAQEVVSHESLVISKISIDHNKQPVTHDSRLVAHDSSIPLEVTITHRDRAVPCIDYHVKQCSGPCIGAISPGEYRTQCIDALIEFYKGDTAPVLETLLIHLEQASDDRKFERAAQLRDAVECIDQLKKQYLLFGMTKEYADIIAIAVSDQTACAVILQQRGGNIVNELSFPLSSDGSAPAEMLSQFLIQYYDDMDIPERIILKEEPSDRKPLLEWLTGKRGGKVILEYPQRGDKYKLLMMAQKNAEHKLETKTEEKPALAARLF